MDQAIGVIEVRAAILAIGESSFTADDVADQMDVDDDKSMRAIRKVLGYMTMLDELRRDSVYDPRTASSKPTRWKVIRLNEVSAVPKFSSNALFGSMLGWKKLTP